MASVLSKAATAAPARTRRTPRRAGLRLRRFNVPAGVAGWLWLAVIIIPIYYVVITSLKTQAGYFGQNPLAVPTSPTLENYKMVLAADFARYFVNSALITVGTVVPSLAFSFMASFAIVRGSGRFLKSVNALFLMGLAIPLQAVIIPIYLMIIKMHLYDSLLAIILPSIAFAIPLSVLIMANFIRDVPNELFESMRLDGCSEWQTLWRLALPLTKPAIVTVAIYNGLGVWNGFLLPLILTQSPELRVLPLALWTFQGEYSVNIPAVLASVVLTTLPILVLYIVGRRQLLSGLTAGFSK
ncbi:carbohydrate ABC transporter permease [Arthrobacter sp. STN4]|uniref:carbohydrate ABC transporter permease n=1 Tax=Arthrobacter sp. STN4 TaxID=2923276 RepID=UPI00211A4A18|nr:carbohydrate ABC transporter permease [Arthrobacter sp. STN4]MCQ9162761.1 carbohydrate ABC transporter permease [Arthrobacter sp. STN4]